MKTWNRTLLGLSLGALLIAGCGDSDSSFVVTDTSVSTQAISEDQRLLEAALANPGKAHEIVPVDHLNPLRPAGNLTLQSQQSAPSFLSVADLESNYETLFGSLSEKFGVTLQSPQNQQNIAYIKAQDGTGHFDLDAKPILNNPLGVTGVAFQKIQYQTTVPLPNGEQTFNVSGGLLMPTGIPASQLKGIVVYFHGTTFSKAGVGSDFSRSETQLCAQVFGSQGYAVVIPDYVGQGDDWAHVHPYVLYPQASAQTAADMLTAVKDELSTFYQTEGAFPTLKLFSAGYSEGGAYSLWFNTYLKSNPSKLDPQYVLTHSVGMEGAYSTSQAIFDYLFEDVSPRGANPFGVQSLLLVNFVKPALSADAFLSYVTYTVTPSTDFGAVFNTDFFAMNATPPMTQDACNVNGAHVSMDTAFAQPNTNIAGQLVFSGLGKTANDTTYPDLLALAVSQKNSVKSLISSSLLSPAPFAQLQETMRAADVDLSVCDDDGVSIVTLDQDSVVVPVNFSLLSQAFPSKIQDAYTVDHNSLMVVSPFSGKTANWVKVDHLGAPPFEFLYALNTFNGF